MSPSIIPAEGYTMPSKLKSLVQAQKPDIRINLSSRQKTYTTLDRIEGTVTVVPHADTPFDAVDIEFVGTARTYVERLTTAAAASGRSEAFHQFLKLQQPGLHQSYPRDLVLRAGKIYDFPFVFAVPQQLLPRVCQHTVRSDAVRDAHLRLPPTFNDSGLAQKGFDDMAPDMASIRYGVFAKISEVRTKGDDAFRSTIASKARRLRVIPAVEEQPPLAVHNEDKEYILRKEKVVRKGLLKGKLGSLVMEAVQPAAIKMRSYNNPESKLTTMATIMLRFDPLEEDLSPPKLGNLASKLKVTTFYASTARSSFPNKNSAMFDLCQGLHTEQLNLSSRCVANAEWTKQESCPSQGLQRRDSAMSSNSLETGEIPDASETYKGGIFYTARLLVPISLPNNKAFPPTFHTCLVSRVYCLKLELGVSSSIGSSLEVKLPIQISSEDIISDDFVRRGSIGVEEQDIDVEDVSSFFSNVFEPRTIRVPSENFLGRSRIGSQAPTSEDSTERSRIGSQAPISEAPEAPPGYTPITGQAPPTARMTHHRAMSVPVY